MIINKHLIMLMRIILNNSSLIELLAAPPPYHCGYPHSTGHVVDAHTLRLSTSARHVMRVANILRLSTLSQTRGQSTHTAAHQQPLHGGFFARPPHMPHPMQAPHIASHLCRPPIYPPPVQAPYIAKLLRARLTHVLNKAYGLLPLLRMALRGRPRCLGSQIARMSTGRK